MMAQPRQDPPSRSSHPNLHLSQPEDSTVESSLSLAHGEQRPNELLQPQSTSFGDAIENPDSPFSSQFYPVEDWSIDSILLGSSQTSNTGLVAELYQNPANPVEADELLIDPRLRSSGQDVYDDEPYESNVKREVRKEVGAFPYFSSDSSDREKDSQQLSIGQDRPTARN